MMMSSALRIACAASGLTCAPSGLRKTWLIGAFCLGIFDSPSTVLPLIDATRVTSCSVDGHDRALDREHLPGFAQRVLEVSGDVGHRHDEEVSEGVAVERALLEAMVEELLHQRLGVGQRDQALAEVAGRQDPILVAQPA